MAQAKNVVTINQFRGCDFTNAGTDMDADKSPNCVNMIRDVPGKIRKRMGYKLDNNYGAQINGYHYLANEKLACIHAGTEIYNVGGMGQFTSKDLAPYVVDLAEFKVNAEYSIEGLTRQ